MALYNMKNKLEYIKNSWTYNHKMLIIALSLATAHVYPLIEWPTIQAETVTYEKPATVIPFTLEQKAEQRAREIYKERESYDLEKYRHEALKEMNTHLLDMIDDSPFVNYKDLEAQYAQ